MKPSKPIPRMSEKKRASLKGPVFSTISKRSESPRKRPRKKSEFARIYGSEERLSWVTRMPCAACQRAPTYLFPSHNHHTKTGGTSRKADANTIIPLCSRCHIYLHNRGREWFENTWGIDLEKCAAETELAWLSRIPEREE